MTPAKRRDEATRAMDGLRRLVHALGATNRECERTVGLDAAALFVLGQIEAAPALSLAAVAERALTNPGAVSDVLDRLVEAGLAGWRRASGGEGRDEIDVTERGRALLRAAPETVQTALISGFERLPAAQRRALVEGIEAWLVSAHLESVPATMLLEPGTRKSAGRLRLPWKRGRS